MSIENWKQLGFIKGQHKIFFYFANNCACYKSVIRIRKRVNAKEELLIPLFYKIKVATTI